ncbi:hypothetical protein B0H15DRAFT_799671 [Mycena belliarum]|uniref:Uncharacterized protein n=1 Tax=Mycena belliarum TaxID=1033014 RepID=A0AAD6XTH9_9AGAR|nr:hypothetical protein B0H15DRAFT_799671 [Mycena belliae]
MPLFKSPPPADDPAPAPEPARKPGFFTRRRSLSPPAANPATDPNHPANAATRRGFFARNGRASLDGGAPAARTASVRSSNTTTSGRSGGSGFFARAMHPDVHKDPAVLAAREKVAGAERAEAAADHALLQARAMVREAKEHVRVLEREAAAEAKRAQQKQAASNDVSKSASGLGRHGP